MKKRKFLNTPVIAFSLIFLVIMWLGFGKSGLIDLYRAEEERRTYLERINKLVQENQTMIDEVNRLRTDMSYVESIVRRELNLIRENEVIYRFDEEKQNDPVKKHVNSKDYQKKTEADNNGKIE